MILIILNKDLVFCLVLRVMMFLPLLVHLILWRIVLLAHPLVYFILFQELIIIRNDIDDDWCLFFQISDQHLLVECDACHKHYHLQCLDPPLERYGRFINTWWLIEYIEECLRRNHSNGIVWNAHLNRVKMKEIQRRKRRNHLPIRKNLMSVQLWIHSLSKNVLEMKSVIDLWSFQTDELNGARKLRHRSDSVKQRKQAEKEVCDW